MQNSHYLFIYVQQHASSFVTFPIILKYVIAYQLSENTESEIFSLAQDSVITMKAGL